MKPLKYPADTETCGQRGAEAISFLEKFNLTLDWWIEALAHYDYAQLCLQPTPASWSLGQVYVHLLEETRFFVQEMETCLTTLDHASEQMNEAGQHLFQTNSFPNQQLLGPAGLRLLPQPTSKAQLRESMAQLKGTLNGLGKEIAQCAVSGKTKHPGYLYFSAAEWLQYAEMHMRHHFRQKERIDAFLMNIPLKKSPNLSTFTFKIP